MPLADAVVLVPLPLSELLRVPPVEALVVRRPQLRARRRHRRGSGRGGRRRRGRLAPAKHHPSCSLPAAAAAAFHESPSLALPLPVFPVNGIRSLVTLASRRLFEFYVRQVENRFETLRQAILQA